MSSGQYRKSRAHDAVGRFLDGLGIDPDRKVELMDAAGRVRRVYFENRQGFLKALGSEMRQEYARSARSRVETRATGYDTRQLARIVDRHPLAVRTTLVGRICTVIATLSDGDTAPPSGTADLLDQLAALLGVGTEHERACRMWLALSVIGARLATADEVLKAVRLSRGREALSGLAVHLVARPSASDLVDVEVVIGEVVVDVHTTARSDVLTGIQRVVHQSVRRWHRDHALRFVGWTPGYSALRPLAPAEERAVLHGEVLDGLDRADALYGTVASLIVPWSGTYLLPELVTDLPRSDRIQAIARFSRCTTGTIGYDCVPVSSGETCGPGTPSGFVRTLAAVAHFDRVVAISEAAAGEYRGWQQMLGGAGLVGPDICAVLLAAEAERPEPEVTDAARARLSADGLPMVLCVGSHEPRKNHLAVVHAAEILWSEGVDFRLVFVGGNSWKDDGFAVKVRSLTAAGRPVELVRAAGDELLWGAYAAARCTIFPSLNEGFGLPVAESLALGTPAITSNFGSMAEIAADGGALLVDPRDDRAITDGLRRLLTDDDLHARLTAEAGSRSVRTWDVYAAEAWKHLIADV